MIVHAHRPDQKPRCGLLLFPLLCAVPEEPLVWERINRELEQLKALFRDRDKTPCACDELPPNKDLLSHSGSTPDILWGGRTADIHPNPELQVLHRFPTGVLICSADSGLAGLRVSGTSWLLSASSSPPRKSCGCFHGRDL